MAFTNCLVTTNNVAALDDQPNDVGGLTPTQLKAVFDKYGTDFVAWFNATHIVEGNAHIVEGNAHLADYVRQPAYGQTAGLANVYTFTSTPALPALVDGVSAYLDINVANTGASTLDWDGMGAKPIVDGKGVALTAGKLPLNGIVGVRYNLSTTSFQLQGEGASGNAIASDLLSGKTAGTDAGDIVGTLNIPDLYDVVTFGDGSDGIFNSVGNVTWAVGADDAGPVIKKFSNFTLNTGHSLALDRRSKAMIILCTGNVVINGTISMNNQAARIARVASGDSWGTYAMVNYKDPSLSKLINTLLQLGGAGGAGGAGGVGGAAGGGGGGGGAFGGHGGGGGGGGIGSSDGHAGGGGGGGAGTGGAGGAGGYNTIGGVGGAGGVGASAVGGVGGVGTSGSSDGGAGGAGGGGLIILMCKGTLTISNTGIITASSIGAGGAGGAAQANGVYGGGGGGGGAGGGGGVVFIGGRGTYSNLGVITVNAGTGGAGGAGGVSGGAGVIGSIVIKQL
jgi:hypothetical protein